MITGAYFIGLYVLYCFYGSHFALTVYFMSLGLALVPFATSKWLFGLPILWWIWACAFGNHHLALWALLYAPLHWICWGGATMGFVKRLANIDEW